MHVYERIGDFMKHVEPDLSIPQLLLPCNCNAPYGGFPHDDDDNDSLVLAMHHVHVHMMMVINRCLDKDLSMDSSCQQLIQKSHQSVYKYIHPSLIYILKYIHICV